MTSFWNTAHRDSFQNDRLIQLPLPKTFFLSPYTLLCCHLFHCWCLCTSAYVWTRPVSSIHTPRTIPPKTILSKVLLCKLFQVLRNIAFTLFHRGGIVCLGFSALISATWFHEDAKWLLKSISNEELWLYPPVSERFNPVYSDPTSTSIYYYLPYCCSDTRQRFVFLICLLWLKHQYTSLLLHQSQVIFKFWWISQFDAVAKGF